MLINCPRCGFSQPQDQYCAQCGVDMQSFKPKAPSLMKRVFGNAGVQIFILILAAVLVGQSIIHRNTPQSWARKISPFQGISRSSESTLKESENLDVSNENIQPPPAEQTQLSSLRDTEATAANTDASTETVDPNTITFHLIFAEVSRETLAAWIAESTGAGLYQNMPEYAAGIIPDFSKKIKSIKQVLKSTELKLLPGGTNSHISGTTNPEGNQLIGLVAALEYNGQENEVVQGNISLTRNNGRTSENFPAEFHLGQDSAFFIEGALKRDSFNAEKARLNMPPFQIFQSPDFNSGKSELIVILQPDLK